jgi:ankyrin repeat protein
MSKCSVCKEKKKMKVYYCSKKCQELDWPEHKKLHRETEHAAETTNGADPNGMTELMSRLWIGDNDQVISMLKTGADVAAFDFQGFSALDYAISRGNLEIAKQLLENHPQLLDIRKVGRARKSCFSLILACQTGQVELVRLILSLESGKALISDSEHHFRPIYFACQFGHHEIVKLLLEVGGDAQAFERALCGSFPLGIACQKGHTAVVQALVKGCGPRLLHMKDSDGDTALHIACLNGHAEVRLYLFAYIG